MRIIFIRHGLTEANLEKRYIGRTDQSLCIKGSRKLYQSTLKGVYPKADIVYVSPLKRCIETADIIYTYVERVIINGFIEKDFGEYELKNYEDLKDDKEYIRWVNSNGTLPFPTGEDDALVKKRILDSFDQVLDQCIKKNTETAALIVHGGTIMTILSERLSSDRVSFYDYQCECQNGYITDYDNGDLRLIGEIKS